MLSVVKQLAVRSSSTCLAPWPGFKSSAKRSFYSALFYDLCLGFKMTIIQGEKPCDLVAFCIFIYTFTSLDIIAAILQPSVHELWFHFTVDFIKLKPLKLNVDSGDLSPSVNDHPRSFLTSAIMIFVTRFLINKLSLDLGYTRLLSMTHCNSVPHSEL